MDFPKQRYLNEFKATGLSFDKIDYVFCTHLHIDHCGWNTVLRDGRGLSAFLCAGRSSVPPTIGRKTVVIG